MSAEASMTIPILYFRIEGPLQSWGEHSYWDYRDTADFPSKSGVMGLLCCAAGIERGDSRISDYCSHLTLAIRADRRGSVLKDFHTIQSDKILTAKGKQRAGGNTIVTKRSYIQDASFLIAISGEEDMLEFLFGALQNPKWPIYLGRKSCLPSVPVYPYITKEFTSLTDFINAMPLISRHDDRVLCQIDDKGSAGIIRSDIIADSARREFLLRSVTVFEYEGQNKNVDV